ncbi:hypothetical protein DFH09DRAFT_1095062 [Mycena vulgaris]|nr:hypothetical protein DFH09DRAFT_1095062 [Mycena vulgaris]
MTPHGWAKFTAKMLPCLFGSSDGVKNRGLQSMDTCSLMRMYRAHATAHEREAPATGPPAPPPTPRCLHDRRQRHGPPRSADTGVVFVFPHRAYLVLLKTADGPSADYPYFGPGDVAQRLSTDWTSNLTAGSYNEAFFAATSSVSAGSSVSRDNTFSVGHAGCQWSEITIWSYDSVTCVLAPL